MEPEARLNALLLRLEDQDMVTMLNLIARLPENKRDVFCTAMLEIDPITLVALIQRMTAMTDVVLQMFLMNMNRLNSRRERRTFVLLHLGAQANPPVVGAGANPPVAGLVTGKPWKCRFCPKSYVEKKALIDHELKKHRPAP